MARHFLSAVVAGLMLLALLQLAANARAQTPTSFSFNLLGPNTAMAPNGFTLKVTGSGSFDTATETITGGGSFWIIAPDGTIVDRGTYVVTTFLGFTSYGGPRPGTQGGFLEAAVTATSSVTGAVTEDIPATVSCLVNAPAGAPDEGITSVPFTESTGGLTLFHVED